MRLREPLYLASLLWAALLVLPAHAARAAETDLDSKAGALDRGATTREERSAIFTKFGVPNTALHRLSDAGPHRPECPHGLGQGGRGSQEERLHDH